MSETTETTPAPERPEFSRDVKFHSQAARMVRECPTIQAAEKFVEGETRPTVLEALKIKKEMATAAAQAPPPSTPPDAPSKPTTSPSKTPDAAPSAPIIAGVGHLQASILKLGAGGIPQPRDFDDREAGGTGVPDWLPSHDASGREVVYAKLGKDDLLSHPFISGPNAWMSPVTRDTFPNVSGQFNVEGNVSQGDLIICVGYRENANKRLKVKIRNATQRVQILEPKARTITTKAPDGDTVEGAVTSGMGRKSASIDQILGAMPSN